MLYQIRRVRQHIVDHNIIADADRCAKQMRIAEHCLERMLYEPAYETADKRFPERGKPWADLIFQIEKQNAETLARELRRHLRNWWD
jgi:hypothetical protein